MKELEDAEKSFVVPDKNLPAHRTPTLNLFLHSVKENRELRDNAPTVEFKDGVVTSLPCAAARGVYLPGHRWGRKDPNRKRRHRRDQLLGEALYWLSRFSTIPKDYLRGSLVNQPYAVPMQVAHMPGVCLGQFWTALGIAPWPPFYLTVTIAMQVVSGPNNLTTSSRRSSPTSLYRMSQRMPVLQGTVKVTRKTPRHGCHRQRQRDRKDRQDGHT